MITLCWAAKGGSGTTVTVAALALSSTTPTVIVDLDGDLPTVLGIDEPSVGVVDWLAGDTPADHLSRLSHPITDQVTLVPAGRPWRSAHIAPHRWDTLIDHLSGRVVVDAGTGPPPPQLYQRADERFLVTRACYLSLTAAVRGPTPTGIILVDEPGRRLKARDIETACQAPLVSRILVDPTVASAVDTGLLAHRLPRSLRHLLAA